MKSLHTISFILLVIGGLNWLLVGLFNWNLVVALLGNWPMLVQIVYVLVGLSAIVEIVGHKSNCKCCTTGPAPMAN